MVIKYIFLNVNTRITIRKYAVEITIKIKNKN